MRRCPPLFTQTKGACLKRSRRGLWLSRNNAQTHPAGDGNLRLHAPTRVDPCAHTRTHRALQEDATVSGRQLNFQMDPRRNRERQKSAGERPPRPPPRSFRERRDSTQASLGEPARFDLVAVANPTRPAPDVRSLPYSFQIYRVAPTGQARCLVLGTQMEARPEEACDTHNSACTRPVEAGEVESCGRARGTRNGRRGRVGE